MMRLGQPRVNRPFHRIASASAWGSGGRRGVMFGAVRRAKVHSWQRLRTVLLNNRLLRLCPGDLRVVGCARDEDAQQFNGWRFK
jgi:hypothetical protein